MRQFIKSALKKLGSLSPEEMQKIFRSATGEIDMLETVLDSFSEGILVCDSGHNLILANKYALRLLPINTYEQVTEPVWNMVGDRNVASFLERTLNSGDRADEWEFDAELYGRMKNFNLSVWPLVQNRQVTGSIIHVIDITEKRNREQRMRRMENLASLTTVAAGVAHEIKNPLGSLSIHVQLIQKALDSVMAIYEQLPDKYKKNRQSKTGLDTIERHLSVVNEEIDRLNQIVVDFLFAVRPMDLETRPSDFNILLNELIEFVSPELKKSKIICCLDLQGVVPKVNIDERYMKQSLLNLINNAVAAMPSGGRLMIKTAVAEGGLIINLADTGVGIPEDNLHKIFEPYFTTRDTGTGLGLTMVYKTIKEHQGEIHVESTPDQGTVFTITLPIPQNERMLIGAPE